MPKEKSLAEQIKDQETALAELKAQQAKDQQLATRVKKLDAQGLMELWVDHVTDLLGNHPQLTTIVDELKARKPKPAAESDQAA